MLRGMRILLALVLALSIGAPAVSIAGPSQADLVKTRTDLAAKAYASSFARLKSGTGTVDQVAAWSTRWLVAMREAPLKGAKLKSALAEHLARMKDLETAVADLVKAGAAPAS